MNSYTFFFDRDTFEKNQITIKSGIQPVISYVGFADARPFNSFQPGDELFIVGLSNKRVHLAGRMVVGAAPTSREQAIIQSGRTDLFSLARDKLPVGGDLRAVDISGLKLDDARLFRGATITLNQAVELLGELGITVT